MKRKEMYALMAGVAAVLCIAMTMVFIGVPNIQKYMNTSEALLPNKITNEQNTFTPGTPVEGIVVHGHWEIEVRNPEGSVAASYEFENALDSEGGITLAQILARQKYMTGWTIALYGASSPFTDDTGIPAEAQIVESVCPNTGRQFFKNLTIDIPTSGVNQNKLVLSGTAVASREGAIHSVMTILSVAPTPTTLSYGGLGRRITSTTLSSPVPLNSGQTVTVTVVISFS